MKITKHKRNDSICDTPVQLLSLMSHIQYSEFAKLMSPLEVLLSTHGSCHDQVMFEMQELYDMGYDPKAKFIMNVFEDGQGDETHSFVYYEDNGKWYWFENAWQDLAGIREYFSEQDLIDSVMYAFGTRNGFDKLYIADFSPADHTIGEDLETLVDICMNSAEEYIVE